MDACSKRRSTSCSPRRARRGARGGLVTYSPKVFIPLTKLCRDVCHYCTFARPPRRGERAFLTLDEVLEIARAGAAAGCREALFTLGDKPELRYRAARDELAALGCATTLEYLARRARLVLEETGLLPHLNPGVLTRGGPRALRPVSASMGIMLETTAERLVGARRPALRLARQAAGGAARDARGSRASCAFPFTTGILIGIGETRDERLDALLAIAALHERARPRAGGDRPELPRQAGHADGRRARSRRSTSSSGRSRPRGSLLRPDVARAGAAEPRLDDFPRLLDAASTTGAASRR